MGNRPEEPSEIYLREISTTPLLTPEEEIKLAGIMENGTPEQGAKAREQMICANLRLVVKIAQDYANYGLPLTDLISEGNMGLMKAVERFEPGKGGKLSTYAAWWIKQHIKGALANQSKTIRLPVHMIDKIAKVRRIRMLLTEDLEREPTEAELAEEVGLPHHKLAMIRQASHRTASLNDIAPSGYDDDSTEYGDFIPDELAVNPLSALIESDMRAHLPQLLNLLDDRERIIIEARFGLNRGNSMILKEVGKEFKVTRERIRQLQNGAIVKMRKWLSNRETMTPEAYLPSEGVATSLGEVSSKKDISQLISHFDQSAHEKNKRILLQDSRIRVLRSKLLREKKGMKMKDFWKELSTIYLEGTNETAADMLKGIIIYHLRVSGEIIPRVITRQHILDFFQKKAA